jgi:hypothetical protein
MTLPHNETPDDQDRVCRHEGAGQWNCAADSYDVGRQTITRQNITQFSDWATGNDVPTAVALASFTATPQDNAVLLRWETASEIDALGFNLYRSEAPGGTYTCLNATLIPAQVPGTPSGAVYTWLDWQVEPHAVYYYRLESLDTHGQRMFYGPLEATTAAAMQWHAYLPLLLQDAP